MPSDATTREDLIVYLIAELHWDLETLRSLTDQQLAAMADRVRAFADGETDVDRLMAGFIDYAKRAEKAARLERSLADMLKPRPATLADVLKNPAGTLLRRRSWPIHWWVEIVHPKGFVGLKYVAIADGRGPNGREFFRGHAVTFGDLGIEASTATDWEVLDEPPIKVVSPFDALDPAKTHPRDVTCALMINGRLIPVEKLPDAPGRKMTVLVVEPS